MKNSTKDKMQGGAREIKGKLKEATGVVTGNRRLQAQGRGEKIAGKVQKKVGQVEKVLED
jgi:uncharacterized protein YjbJ (UPF0337 family)